MSVESVQTISKRRQPAYPQSVPSLEPPPLHAGDRLSRAEFERRYQAHAEIKKAELIEGVVYMPTPVRFEQHGRPNFLREGVYETLEPDANGVLRSEVFPELWLQSAALWSGDLAAMLAVLQEGLDSPEHADFLTRLRA